LRDKLFSSLSLGERHAARLFLNATHQPPSDVIKAADMNINPVADVGGQVNYPGLLVWSEAAGLRVRHWGKPPQTNPREYHKEAQ
jgi:hypothetical protein